MDKDVARYLISEGYSTKAIEFILNQKDRRYSKYRELTIGSLADLAKRFGKGDMLIDALMGIYDA